MNASQFADPNKLPLDNLIDETNLSVLLKTHKLSPDEYQNVLNILGRRPTMAELGVFSSMWSEHCSYKSSRIHLKRLPSEGAAVVVGPGENAGVVRLSGKLCAAFKMESHNHPSYIEPYQGAATGVGGILRDVFCMGARPVANLNCLRFGKRSHHRTPYLFDHVVKGIGDYGNCVGIPTVGGNISFDESYDGNCLVNAMTVGLIHEDRIFKGYASGENNLLIYLGSATGRDGIHGATMASDSFASAEEGARSTVQVGDPFTEKLLLEATLEALAAGLVVGLQDMGAAGLTSSSFEMASRAGQGLYLDLDRIPTRTSGMTAYELLLSESQERMLMVVKPEDWPSLRSILEKWQLAMEVVGYVTSTGRVQIQHQGRLVADVPVDPITEKAPRYERPQQPYSLPVRTPGGLEAQLSDHSLQSLATVALGRGGDPRPVFEQYDRHIGTKSLMTSDEGGAAVLWLRSEWSELGDENLGLVISTACNERLVAANPRLGAAHAVLKCARMIAASGGEPLAITDCLNYGNPEDPKVMWQIAEGVDGIADACRELSTPVVSGNVSLYNETDGVSIKPTPMIGMVGRIKNALKAVPAVAKASGTLCVLVPQTGCPTYNASLLQAEFEKAASGPLQDIDWQAEREALTFMQQAAAGGRLVAARELGSGMLPTALKMILGQGLGLDFKLPESLSKDVILSCFGEYHSGYLLVVKADELAALKAEAVTSAQRCRLEEVGFVTEARRVEVQGSKLDYEALRLSWRSALAEGEKAIAMAD